MVAGSKTPANFQALHKKYEDIVKTLIQQEPGDWESFIIEIKILLEF